MVHVVFPTITEAASFVGLMDSATPRDEPGLPGWAGMVAGRHVSVTVCGIGQVNAARAVTVILEKGGAGLVVLGGCAGAFDGSGLGVGDVALASEEVYAGLGIDAPGGFITLEDAGLPLVEVDGVRYYGAMPLPAASRLDIQGLSSGGVRVVAGRFLTVTTVTGTTSGGALQYRRYGAQCENMEGAAAAQVALVYGADIIEVRGISNMAIDRDRESWDIPLASANCARVIKDIISGWEG